MDVMKLNDIAFWRGDSVAACYSIGPRVHAIDQALIYPLRGCRCGNRVLCEIIT
jgi:hypothetical protein